ncbi:hypothetical protein GV819_07715 [Pseudomonas sp. Fl5BN2]|uniref:hypothetical protein n=1 Tax=Pseudomonas sp. Fl5BN2 TaxID=2697652 RepID=UPI001377CE58|nr:hypothetical protein [Pseudomonas sp. Fl5BN2]NBF02178.1 hypothetical protein [Pseudomonas sp. Fl5BN2]
MQFLFAVEDVFSITGQGCVLVPGVPHDFAHELKSGAPLLICTPQGEHIHTHIEYFVSVRSTRTLNHIPFSLPAMINKERIPTGSQVYLQDDVKK